MTNPLVTVVGFLLLDRITCSAGTFSAVPGGAAYYCAAAAAVAGANVRLAAKVGEDFPVEAIQALENIGVDTTLIERLPLPSRRSTLRDPDGRNRSLPHINDPLWWETIERFAPPLPKGQGIFVYTAMPADLLEQQCNARSIDDILVVDTSPAYAATSGGKLLSLLSHFDCFAPSKEETRLLLPALSDAEALKEIARQVPLVIQKRGSAGLALRRGEKLLTTGSVSTTIVDTTGAGDSVVGALAASLARGLDDVAMLRECSRVAALAVSGIGASGLVAGIAHPKRQATAGSSVLLP